MSGKVQSPERKAESEGKELRHNLGLDNPEELEFNYVSDVESLERYGGEGLAGHFSPRFDEIIIYGHLFNNGLGETGAHEIEHKDQVERFNSVDTDDTYWEVMRESNLATRTGRNPGNIHENHSEGELLQLLPKLGYSKGVLASWLKERPEVRDNLYSFEEEIDGSDLYNSTKLMLAETGKEHDIDGFPDPDEVEIRYSDETIEGLLGAHRYLQEQKDEDEVLRWADPRLSAEREGFAHFLSGVIKEREFREERQRGIDSGLHENHEDAPDEIKYEITDRKDAVEDADCYDRLVPGEGATVGEMAAERLEDLAKVKHYFEEPGRMEEEEAVAYIMDEVQEKTFEYAISEMQEYETVDEVEERLVKA
jgi:hypothetical protein